MTTAVAVDRLVHHRTGEEHTVRKFPVIALRQTISERWAKQTDEDLANEIACSTTGELKENRYHSLGWESDLEFVWVSPEGRATRRRDTAGGTRRRR
jgi:hypothetical protein